MVAMFTPHSNAFRFYDDDGGEAASTPLAAQDTDVTIAVNSNKAQQVRFRVDETGGASGSSMDDYALEYSKNGGAFTALTTADSGAGIRAAAAGLTNDAATTNRATNGISDPGLGSFVAGEQSDDGIVDDMLLSANDFTEHAYGFELIAANVADGDTFDLRFTGSVTNNVTPRATVSKSSATSGSGAQTLPVLTQAGSGAQEFTGGGAQALQAPTQAGDGVMQPEASGAQNPPAVTQSGAGVEEMPGVGAQTVEPLAQSAAAIQEMSGGGAQALSSMVQAGAGTHGDSTTGGGAQSLPAAGQAAAGAELFIGAADSLLPGLLQSGAAAIALPGSAVMSLPALVQSGARASDIVAGVTRVFGGQSRIAFFGDEARAAGYGGRTRGTSYGSQT